MSSRILPTTASDRARRAERGIVRLLSANLWNGNADAAGFAALVSALEPDVVAVQEISWAQAKMLTRLMPHGVLHPDDNYMGMGIALREPAEVRSIDLPCFDAGVVEVAANGHNGHGPRPAIEVINVHVIAPHVLPSRRTHVYRRGQLRGLERYLDATPRRPRVLLGDFNATPVWPVYRRIARRLTDAAVAVASRNGRKPERTWRPMPRAPRLLRIDHAFVAGVHVEDFRVIPLGGGDHCAIVVDVRAADHGSLDAPHA